MENNNVREKVRKHYGKIAEKAGRTNRKASCCGPSSCSCGTDAFSAPSIYKGTDMGGVPDGAVNASLGCGNPFVFAKLAPGEVVLDLGSGGGIDVLAAAKYVGEEGLVYGLDMTDEMLKLANANKARMGVTNVEFLKGYIEDIPLPDNTVDVVMSNCVINLSDDKPRALAEAYRVLKPGGRLAVADIVTVKPCPESVRKQLKLWFACVSGALHVDEYKTLLEHAGFKDVVVEPTQVYSQDVIEELLGAGKVARLKKKLKVEDGIFASGLIRAVK